MTVKCLTDAEKVELASAFSMGAPINFLAEINGCSRRTVIRTLEEIGIEPGIKRRRRQPKPTPLPTVIPTKTPWWSRVIEKVKDISQRRFSA